MTTTTNRSELFNAISEITKELRKKIDSIKSYEEDGSDEYVSLGRLDQTVKWVKEKPNDRDSKMLKATESSNSEPYHSFDSDTDKGMVVGLTCVKVADRKQNFEDNKVFDVVVVGSKVEDHQVILKTNLYWYDHFRPSIINLKRLVKHARRMRVKHKAIAIEHQLAKIVPDRIDRILLEGERGGEERDS